MKVKEAVRILKARKGDTPRTLEARYNQVIDNLAPSPQDKEVEAFEAGEVLVTRWYKKVFANIPSRK